MKIIVDWHEGEPNAVRIEDENGRWFTFWRSTYCQERALQAAKDARELAEQRSAAKVPTDHQPEGTTP